MLFRGSLTLQCSRVIPPSDWELVRRSPHCRPDKRAPSGYKISDLVIDHLEIRHSSYVTELHLCKEG
jgi:hypothetical protein